ncbi:MAG: hypothetical protein QGF59_17030 [Pirellulaceae bacterium]|jgi:hypothetical protein|nr:hypothetical protein [Pirellulaceae bacterium]
MNESDQLDILNAKIESVLDWAREELDVTLIGIVGVLDSMKFEVLCELHGIEPEEDEEDYDALA